MVNVHIPKEKVPCVLCGCLLQSCNHYVYMCVLWVNIICMIHINVTIFMIPTITLQNNYDCITLYHLFHDIYCTCFTIVHSMSVYCTNRHVSVCMYIMYMC